MPSGEASGAAHGVLVTRLRAMSALDSLSDESLHAVVDAARYRTFPQETTVLSEGDPSKCFFILLQGRMKLCRSLANGRTALLGLLGPGDVFGIVAALGRDCSDASVVALEGVACLEVPSDSLLFKISQTPTLLTELMPILTSRLAECRRCLLEVSCFRVECRFAHLLLDLAKTEGIPRAEGTFLPIRLSRQELADMTGTTIETCIRVMSRWSKQKIVETRKNGFLVRNLGRLRETAEQG